MYLKWRGKRAYAVSKIPHDGGYKEHWEPLGKFHRKIDGQEAFVRKSKILSGAPDKLTTFSRLEPSFLGWYKSTHSAETVKWALKHWLPIREEFGSRRVDMIDAMTVEKFKAKHDWALSTWKNRLILLKQFIEYAKTHGFKTSNPFATIKIRQKKLHEHSPKFPPREKIETLLARMEDRGEENYITALFLTYTGMRPIEFFRLKKEDVKGGRIKVFAKNKTRFIPIHPKLKPHLSKIPLDHNAQAFKNSLQRYCRGLGWGMGEITPYSFRHYFATELLRKTKNIRLVGQVMGHATMQVTARYAWVLDEDQRAGVEMLD